MVCVNKTHKEKTNKELAREKGIKDDVAPKF